jgi:hypothetical protein
MLKMGATAALLLAMSSTAYATNMVTLENPACSLVTGCLFTGNADPNTVDDLMAAYNAAFDPDIDLTWLGATGDSFAGNGQLSGTWSFDVPVDYLAVKAGNQFMLYFVGGATSGTWSTDGLFNPNGRTHPQLGLSHLAYYDGLNSGGSGQDLPTPEVGSWVMMAIGFGLMGVAMRTRREQAAYLA